MRCLLVALVCTLPSVPALACKKIHQTPYELFDRASGVDLVRVGASRGARPVTIPLAVERTLKGGGARFRVQVGNPSCSGDFRKGVHAIVFHDGNELVGIYDGVLDVKLYPGLVASLVAWGAAASDRERALVLVEAAVGADPRLAHEARYELADRPELLAELGPAERQRLVAAATGGWTGTPLPLLLARLREPGLVQLLGTASGPFVSLARNLIDSDAFESVSDRDALAAVIGDLGRPVLERARALDRCERVLARHLVRVTGYARPGLADRLWPELAEACRTATPTAH